MALRRGTTKVRPKDEDYEEPDIDVDDVARDEDDEDEAPAPRKRAAAKNTPAKKTSVRQRAAQIDDDDSGIVPIRSGWDAAEETAKELRSAGRLKLGPTPVLVKFLSAEPLSWKQHFVTSLNKAYVCLSDHPKGCPLCAIGQEAKARYMFAVADLSEEEAERKKLECGPRLLETLQDVHDGPKGPLDRYCINLSSRGKGFDTRFTADVVKDRDLEEDEHISPEDVEEAISDMEPLTASDVYTSTYAELREVAEGLV